MSDEYILPPQPWDRKVLLVVERTQLERCDYEPAGLHLPAGVHPLTLPILHAENDPIVPRLMQLGYAAPGSVLIQNPVATDIYYAADEARLRCTQDKWRAFRSICAHLGVRKAEFVHTEFLTENGRAEFSSDGKVRVVSGNGRLVKQQAEALSASLSIKSTFQGGASDPEAAEEYANRTNLIDDFHVRDLIHNRRSKNPLRVEVVELNLSSEVQKNFELLGEVRVPAFVNLKSEWKQEVKRTYKLQVTMKLEFP